MFAGMYGGTPVAIKRLRARRKPRAPTASSKTHPNESSVSLEGEGGGGEGTATATVTQTHTFSIKEAIAPEQQASFLAEAHSLSTVNHPNCLQLLGCCTDPNNLCIVTEYLKEGDLATLLFASDTLLGDAKKLSILHQIAQGCEYLHLRKEIIHRDLKPGNILLDHNASVVKVADFGLSVLVSKLEDERLRRGGTLKYMSPEQLLGSVTATKASDVFAFGIIMYEVMTCKRAFSDIDRAASVYALPPLDRMAASSTLSLMLLDLLRSTLARNPSDRPSFTSIVSQLEDLRDRLVYGPVWPSVPNLPTSFVPVPRDVNALRDVILRHHRSTLVAASTPPSTASNNNPFCTTILTPPNSSSPLVNSRAPGAGG